jgi:hypothetical protein
VSSSDGNGKLRFTPTEERLLAVLGDGEPHSRDELVACLADELSGWKHVKWHLTSLRKHLRPQRKEVICQVVNRAFKYRLVQLVNR